ncbi:MAG: type II toxin-antitoxin system RelE/ParE family toxin [Alphaproteobacteria bacterium]|nr:type II toxin-antitoxin system RelE/ParE family toxin [Alphaproteobacteria bacterium]
MGESGERRKSSNATALRTVDFSPAALKDLRDIHGYIAERNPEAADDVLSAIQERTLMIAKMPRLKRSAEVFGSGVRVLIYRVYLIFYRVKVRRLEIVRVVDGRRDVPSVIGGAT